MTCPCYRRPTHASGWEVCPQCHWVVAARQMKAALQEYEAYFEERADAEYFTDSAGPVGNDEMRLLVEVQAAIANLPNEVAA
jgi:hypothetical protein